MRYVNDLLIIFLVFALFVFPGTHVLAQSYDSKDRLYEKQKCEKLESGHYHERIDGGDPCETDSIDKKDSNASSPPEKINKDSGRNNSAPRPPSGTEH